MHLNNKLQHISSSIKKIPIAFILIQHHEHVCIHNNKQCRNFVIGVDGMLWMLDLQEKINECQERGLASFILMTTLFQVQLQDFIHNDIRRWLRLLLQVIMTHPCRSKNNKPCQSLLAVLPKILWPPGAKAISVLLKNVCWINKTLGLCSAQSLELTRENGAATIDGQQLRKKKCKIWGKKLGRKKKTKQKRPQSHSTANE